MTSVTVCLVAVSLSLASCVIQSWRGSSPPDEVPPLAAKSQNDSVVLFYIPQYLTDGSPISNRLSIPPLQFAHNVFKQRLATSAEFERAKFTVRPPEKGIFCSIRVSEDIDRHSAWNGILMALSALSVTLIPIYDDNLGYYVNYEVYIDAKMQKRYTYDVRGKSLEWAFAIFAIPFLSGPWEVSMDPYHRRKGEFSHDPLEEALWSTMRQLWIDAQRDGFF